MKGFASVVVLNVLALGFVGSAGCQSGGGTTPDAKTESPYAGGMAFLEKIHSHRECMHPVNPRPRPRLNPRPSMRIFRINGRGKASAHARTGVAESA